MLVEEHARYERASRNQPSGVAGFETASFLGLLRAALETGVRGLLVSRRSLALAPQPAEQCCWLRSSSAG
jgi:hypothetical protein